MSGNATLRLILESLAKAEESDAPAEVEEMRQVVAANLPALCDHVTQGGRLPRVKRSYDYVHHPGPPFATERVTRFEVVDGDGDL